MTAKTCSTCAYPTRRMKWSKPRTWCVRYQLMRDEPCIDYKTKRSAIAQALEYVRLSSIK